LRLPGEDRGGVPMPHEEIQPPPRIGAPGGAVGPDGGMVPPPVAGNPPGQGLPPGQGNPPNQDEIERARGLAREGKPQEALAQFDALISRAPQDAALRSERGTMRLWNNDLRGAREDWAAIASQSPDNVDARKFAAALELVAGDPRASLAQYQELARIRPADPLVLIGQGQASLWTGDTVGAQKSFQQALQISPDLAKSLYEQANQMLSANVPAIAHVQYTTVVWLDPNAYHAYYGLGFAASKLGRKQEAIDAFERYLQRDPSSQFAENVRGELARLRRQ
jgi:tetratricopeptide (TPR) repeat protein